MAGLFILACFKIQLPELYPSDVADADLYLITFSLPVSPFFLTIEFLLFGKVVTYLFAITSLS